MYKVIAEFEDENEVIAKYFIKELENYEEAIEFSNVYLQGMFTRDDQI